MALSPGTTLGGFEIIGLLGRGGMGEVYRARDSKLEREVAIKVLPEVFALDAERLARFEREAKVLATLDHPNIGALYDFQEADGQRFLVMQLVEGETLAERIAKGPISVKEALPLFSQIAEALEAAHESGIIHRDLKPANIKIDESGRIKVLDFGLAISADSDVINIASPTDETTPAGTPSTKLTSDGSIIGTPTYMAPEQARGRQLDKRADIWAFGCCLFEALTGNPPFDGETVADTLATVLEREPDWDALPADTPLPIRQLIQNCLEKDKNNRQRDMGDVRIQMRRQITDSGKIAATVAPGAAPKKSLLPAALIAGAILIAGAGIVFFGSPGNEAPEVATEVSEAQEAADDEPKQVRRYLLGLDVPSITPGSPTWGRVAISPDGSLLAYITPDEEGRRHLAVRQIDEKSDKLLEGNVLPGTESAWSPFFSPDGQSIGFFSQKDGRLKRVQVAGGTPIDLSDAVIAIHASWGEDGYIVFASAVYDGLQRVRDTGGVPEQITNFAMTPGSIVHAFPHVLPGGAGVLFTSATKFSIEAMSLFVLTPDGEVTKLREQASYPRYTSSGHLLYVAANSGVSASRFDLNSLTLDEEFFPLSEAHLGKDWRTNFDVSNSGTLVYIAEDESADATAGRAARTLVWVDMEGNETPLSIPTMPYEDLRISPDGNSVALQAQDDIFVYDIARTTLMPLAFEDDALEGSPIWTPDGQEVTYSSTRAGPFKMYTKRADGTGQPTPLQESRLVQFPGSWSQDGEILLYAESGLGTGFDMGISYLGGDRDNFSEIVIQTDAHEGSTSISPDDKWVAYSSYESGTSHSYVTAFPSFEGKFQISVELGAEIVWAPDGTALYYRSGSKMMRVPVELEPTFQPGNPEPLWDHQYFFTELRNRVYDIHPDGDRFLMIKELAEGAVIEGEDVIVVENFFEELKRIAPQPEAN